MKKYIFVLCAAFVINAHAGQKGNGGGGVRNHGLYQSFYSAGFYVEPHPEETPTVVTQLNELIEFVSNFSDMSPISRAKLLAAIIPTPDRQYFKIDEGAFDEATRERLLDEYARVVKTERSRLEIFAITDTATKRTYLLPSFYKLQASDQMAILFHEAFWILNPTQTYEWIVAAEMAFQAVVEKPKDTLRIVRFMKYYSTKADTLKAALEGDLRARALPDSIRLEDLLGKDYLNCRGGNECKSFALLPLYSMIKQYPNSAVLKLIQASFLEDGLKVGRDGADNALTFTYGMSLWWMDITSCEISMEWVSRTGSETAGLRMGCDQRGSGNQRFHFKNDLILYIQR